MSHQLDNSDEYLILTQCFISRKGTVTLWSPNVKEPLVKMLCHRGPVKAIAIDQGGWYADYDI